MGEGWAGLLPACVGGGGLSQRSRTRVTLAGGRGGGRPVFRWHPREGAGERAGERAGEPPPPVHTRTGAGTGFLTRFRPSREDGGGATAHSMATAGGPGRAVHEAVGDHSCTTPPEIRVQRKGVAVPHKGWPRRDRALDLAWRHVCRAAGPDLRGGRRHGGGLPVLRRTCAGGTAGVPAARRGHRPGACPEAGRRIGGADRVVTEAAPARAGRSIPAEPAVLGLETRGGCGGCPRPPSPSL